MIKNSIRGQNPKYHVPLHVPYPIRLTDLQHGLCSQADHQVNQSRAAQDAALFVFQRFTTFNIWRILYNFYF